MCFRYVHDAAHFNLHSLLFILCLLRLMAANPTGFRGLGDGEVRDGAGGGFNERQERVSDAKNEIDEDGFDDFGRRINSRKVDKKAKEAAALARLKSAYGHLMDDGAALYATTDLGTNIPSTEPLSSGVKRASPSSLDNKGDRSRDKDEARDTGKDRNVDSDYMAAFSSDTLSELVTPKMQR